MSISKIAIYYGLHYLLYVALLPLGGMFGARFGYERSLTASTPLFVCYFLLLAILPTNPQLFWLAAIVLTLFKTLYWPAYHATFSAYTDGNNRGTEQSWMRFMNQGIGVAGPLIGGLIIATLGFPVLFVAAAVLISLAGIPLLRTKENYHLKPLTYAAPWQLLMAKRHRRMVVAMVGWGENLIHLAFWPIFMFILLPNVQLLGFIASISGAVMVAWGFVAGEVTDKLSPRRALKLFVPLATLSYAFRAVTNGTLPMLITADAYSHATHAGVAIPFLARLYRSGHEVGSLKYAVAFELVLALVKAIVAFALAAVFFSVSIPTGFIITFALGAIFSLFYLAL